MQHFMSNFIIFFQASFNNSLSSINFIGHKAWCNYVQLNKWCKLSDIQKTDLDVIW